MTPFVGWSNIPPKAKSETAVRKTGRGAGPRIIRCSNGHYYDSHLYTRCPECNPEDKEKLDRLAQAFEKIEKSGESGVKEVSAPLPSAPESGVHKKESEDKENEVVRACAPEGDLNRDNSDGNPNDAAAEVQSTDHTNGLTSNAQKL